MKELTHRARKILSAVVSEYLQTGEAVGSRTVTRRGHIELSPATVRNVMSDLEEAGLLTQPHTSAGRVPTAQGLRVFIDSMLKVRSLSPREKDEIRSQYGLGTQALDEVMQRTSRVLSDITRYAGVVLAPNPQRQQLRHIEFVPLRENKYLCVLVTTDGHIENKLFSVDFDVARDRLESIHNYLQELISGLTLDEVRQRVLRELGLEKNMYDEAVATALRLSQVALADSPPAIVPVIVSGGANLLDAARLEDGEQLGRMRDLLHALEEKELLVRLLDHTMRSERIQVFLGAETAHAALNDSAVIATPYGPEDRPVGAIAVIGPTRMNYGRVMSVVDFTAGLISELMNGGE